MRWLEVAAGGVHALDRSLGGPSTAAAGAPDKADSGTGLGVAAILAQGSTRRQQQSDTVPSSARTTPLTAGAAAAAAAAVGKRRARSHSPVRHQAAAPAAANLADELSRLLQLEQGAACHTTGECADSPGAAATLQRLDSSGAGAGLQAAAAAVVSQLKAFGAQQGECPCKPVYSVSFRASCCACLLHPFIAIAALAWAANRLRDGRLLLNTPHAAGAGSDAGSNWLADLPQLEVLTQAGPQVG